MFRFGKLKNRLKNQSAFTLIEIASVLMIIAILAAISAPPLFGFIEHGKQINRTNIARTIYLAAQSQLTELRVTKALKAAHAVGDSDETPPVVPGFLGEYYEKKNGVYEEFTDNIMTGGVYELLGEMPENENPDNEYYVRYISKPKGSYPDSAVVSLLGPVIVDKSILNEAVLIEYNINTGVVLSAFYGDALNNGESLVYDDAAGNRNIKGARIYEDAPSRRQGYYGVGETGAAGDPVPATINVWDSNNKPLPDFMSESNINVLYADIKIPKDKISDPLNLLINGIEVEAEINLANRTASASSLNSALSQYNLTSADGKTALVYRCDDAGDFARFIWVLDYAGGDMVAVNSKHSIGEKYAAKAALDGKSNLRAGISGSVSATSYTEAHPYFNTETPIGYERGEFSVLTARHLYNIRYVPDGVFTQRMNKGKTYIDLAPITNFAPIEGKDGDGNPLPFTGKYTGAGLSVSNLQIEITGKDNVGLFAIISKRSGNDPSVLGLILDNPSVKGRNNVGAVCGTLNGFASNIYVRYSAGSDNLISGNANVGGITGANGSAGMLADSVFISPSAIRHVEGADGAAAGGIAGSNISGGKLRRLLFLALAPKGGDGRIRPIVGAGNAADSSKLYYLSGEALRPSEIPEGSGSAAYNAETHNGVGAGVGTDELYFEYQSLLNRDWQRISPSLTIEDALDSDNRFYPYPYGKALQENLAGYPHWPIVRGGGIITISHIAYYEKYNDDTYGLWFAENGADNAGSLKSDGDNRVIAEAGYAILTDKRISGTHYFFASSAARSDGEWSISDNIAALNFVNDPDFITAARNAGKTSFSDEAWVFKLPLDRLFAIGRQSSPLQIMYTVNENGDNPRQISGLLNPLFAKGLYKSGSNPTLPPDPDTFYIRTPWQMRNISELTARTAGAGNETSGKSFSQEIALDFKNTGAGVNSEQGGAAYSDLINTSVVSGAFKGAYKGKGVSNVVISASGERFGLFAQNDGVIQGISLKASKIMSSAQYIGGIAGINAGTIEMCLVSDTSVEGSASAGAVAGLNQSGAAIRTTGVEEAAVAGAQHIGGIAGNNAGVVEDVYFLSANLLEDIPVKSDDGGGIAGNNSGTITRALYLAPAPFDSGEPSVIYPIVHSGSPAAKTADGRETCFFLSGYRYSNDNGRTWKNNANYNRIRTELSREGGGIGLTTKFIDIEWLDFAYNTDFANWIHSASGYPYPALRGAPEPSKWSEADSPARPTQMDRYDWDDTLSTSDRANNLGFINGRFEEPLMNPNNPSSVYPILRIPQITSPPSSQSDTTNGGFNTNIPGGIGNNGGDYYGMYIYYNSNWVQGWNTRPVSQSGYNNPLWNMIEFQRPYPYNLANNRRFGRMRTNYEGSLTGAYIELNADLPGTLYQICETVPGSELYYSFYHARRNAGNTGGSQRMNFYLSGMKNENNTWQYISPSGRPTIIRPCITRRANTPNNTTTQYNTSTITRQTVVYGATGNDAAETVTIGKVDFYDPKAKTTRNAYLIDVWVSNGAASSTAQPTSSSTGYGITFWTDSLPNSNPIGTALNQIPQFGVKNLTTPKTSANASNANQFYLPSALIAAARDNVVGYWDVRRFGSGSNNNGDFSEWKQYYGRYAIPAGQNATEFAYESASTRNDKEGNYLDGITFQSPGFLSIQKYAKMDGEDITFVKPGETVQIELAIKNWGEAPVNNIEIKDQLYPFDEYIEYGGNMRIQKIAADSSVTDVTGSTLTTPSGSGAAAQTLTITLPGSTVLAINEQLTVTFDVTVLNYVKSEPVVDTLLYYFRNQANVTYWDNDTTLRAYTSAYKIDAAGYPNYEKKNASGPEPVQVFIDPVKLSKTVTPSVNGPFEVVLTVENTTTKIIDTTGLVSDIIPAGFEIVGDLPSGAALTEISGGATRITIRNVNLTAEERLLEYTYTVKYTGNAYGMAYISAASDYRYIYDDHTGYVLNVQLKFPLTAVGLRVRTGGDAFAELLGRGESRNFDILSNDMFAERLADDNYDVSPEVILLKKNADGTFGPAPADKNPNGDYQVSENNRYTAALLKSTKELTFTVSTACPPGSYTYEIYYQIKLTATKPGGRTFVLDSEPTKVTLAVTVL